MQRFLITLFTLFLVHQISIAQIVWTDPVFPTPSQPVTIYFDATKGTGGLANCNCDVYIHTGLITSKSTSASDWKYVFTEWGVANDDWKMTPVSGSPNVYSFEIKPSIKERYNVLDANEVIEKISMVFRDATGSKEGKDTGNADIFYDVYPDDTEFTATFVKPSSSTFLTQIGAVIPVEGASSLNATLSLFDNGNLLHSVNNTTTLTHNIMVSTGGLHLVEFVADNGVARDTVSFTYAIPEATVTAPLPEGVEPGINYISDTEVVLAFEAPGKNNIFVIGDFNNWEFQTDFQMNLAPDGKTWWLQFGGLTAGQYYAFQYVVDGTIRTGEPYSNLILDPGNDKWISEEIFPNMPAYPEGKTSGIVSLMQPGAPAFQWQVNNFERPEQTHLVIYEMLMRDFLVQDYTSLTGMLDYFEDLGINAIELMPVNEFDGNNSWGYNPTYHHALDKAYGTPEAFKAFIDECHARGMAVIIDVVFNHAHERNPFCMLYWDDANFQPAANNPWLNPQATHDFSVFFDFNHESEGTRYYVKRTLEHFLDEYRVDGFRFDLSKGFTQNTSGPFNAGPYDATRIATLKEYADAIWANSSDAYVILEHFADNQEERELSDYGTMFWAGAGVHNQYLEAAMGYNSDLSGAAHTSRGWNDPHLISYIESHDEERLVYKCQQFGNSNGDYNTKDLSTALDRAELASTFFYAIPGPKMLWQFAELGYEYSINRCQNGTNNNNCRTDPKPIPTGYINEKDRRDLYKVTRALLELRNNYEVFQTNDFQLNLNGFQKSIRLNHSSMNVVTVGNFAVTQASMSPDFQHEGWWYDYLSGDSLNVTNTSAAINLEPGEYRLYTDVRLDRPDFLTSSSTAITGYRPQWEVFPNPSTGQFTTYLQLEEPTRVEIAIFDLQGRKLSTISNSRLPAGTSEIPVSRDLQPGVYVLRLVADGTANSRKMVIR